MVAPNKEECNKYLMPKCKQGVVHDERVTGGVCVSPQPRATHRMSARTKGYNCVSARTKGYNRESAHTT